MIENYYIAIFTIHKDIPSLPLALHSNNLDFYPFTIFCNFCTFICCILQTAFNHIAYRKNKLCFHENVINLNFIGPFLMSYSNLIAFGEYFIR